MASNKRLIAAGAGAVAEFDPLQNFETVTYTGNGGTQKITGYIRKGAAFNGSSSYIQTTLSPSFGTISHSLWFYADSADSTNALYYFDNRGGRIDVYISGTGSNSVSATSNNVNITATTATSQWNHLLLVYTGWASSYSSGSYGSAITVTAYLNGSSIGTASPTPYGQTTGMRIGRSGGSYYFEGKVDQFRVFNADVSSNISTLYGETYDSSTKSTTDIFNDGSAVALYELDEDGSDTGGTYDATSVTNVNFLGMAFQPDLIWFKNRDQTDTHRLHDSIRGIGKYVSSNSTAAEVTISSGGPQSFDSNGFTTSGGGAYNATSEDYVAWCWKAGGAAVSNTDGTITSTVSANQDAGFSIVKYTAGGTANVGHGLSQAPELIINKSLDGGLNWVIYSADVGTQNFGLFTSAAFSSNSGTWSAVDANTFTTNINTTSYSYINYCFHSVDGYQRISSYSGTTSNNRIYTTDDGTFTGNGGFQPRWVMIKAYGTASLGSMSWGIWDKERGDGGNILYANLSNAEDINTNLDITLNSDGFTVTSSNAYFNTSGQDYIYLAIA